MNAAFFGSEKVTPPSMHKDGEKVWNRGLAFTPTASIPKTSMSTPLI
jgi:hypothetical protein